MLKETVGKDLVTAMKSKDKNTLGVLRMLKSALQMEEIKKGDDLTEEDELTVLTREVKQRRDSRTEFEKANRDDLVAQQDVEIKILEKYLPAQLSMEEIKVLIEEVATELGANSPRDMGKVMGVISKKTKGAADGKVVSQLVKDYLNQ